MTNKKTSAGRRWKYDPGERPKKKHGWGRNEAGFAECYGHLVGKCPRNMGLDTAERLLNEGIMETNPRWAESHPRRIYIVNKGVLYRAVPTQPGVSYHGFPELPEEFDRLDDKLRSRIWDRAEQLGQKRRLERWLRKKW